ncbi:type III polyketide synthase [Propionispora hippei]|uniref:Alkylresorcinol/alkylpyrone synthase n=1 Tax=Propionispora hippei DSM 15287 TaxID=1123003 RepID=A0A1M6M5M1_9FIRM|nr:3-oxoacyl-[acyl-carrier-protein] synthase III C-terminal domain-containing protein [Propionispora hippei]SHJ78766.1 alkylresorcinol/alkylpyrone synthase [Propionispora hippei DSM 15287]
MSGARIMAVGTAVPPYCVRQEEVKALVAGVFKERMSRLDKLLTVFDNTGIETRHLVCPLEWYTVPHSFAEANALYQIQALELAEQAARAAIQQAGAGPGDIGAVFFISSTGIATPTLDTKLLSRLGLSRHTVRLPLWGLGCAGGAAGLARAGEYVKALSGKLVLLVAVELCSLTFQHGDASKANVVGTGLFSDGAAAVVLGATGRGPLMFDSYSTLFDNTAAIMGWDVVESGFKVRFSRDIPSLIRERLPEVIEQACCYWGVEKEKIKHYLVHPGGVKVLQAYEDSLALAPETFRLAYEVLARYGNMSSVSICFVLAEFLRKTEPAGQYGILLSMGPGFCAEQVLFQW